ncbi:MAG TPA: cbb3-type cytochrome oxidase assembly protein CcoS [Nitrospirota bacterium]|jgi:cbb3-type cytochrome oxidase maturation protein
MASFLPMLIISLSIGIAAWLVFMWAVRSGQFDDIEGPKHRMLDDDDERESGDKDDNKDGSKGETGDEDGKEGS